MTNYVKCFPLGNADSTLIKLASGKSLLFDFAATGTGEQDDCRCNLPQELDSEVKGDFEVVGFSHGDLDHLKGFHDYFYLRHAAKYQEGKRKKILDLWVPAQVLLETACDDETRILRAEARFRLKEKKGIKVFSKPGKLKDWLEAEKIPFDDVKHLIVDAGKTVPGWGPTNSEVELFVHAPFAFCSDGEEINRNDACFVLQATFRNMQSSKLLLTGDANWELLQQIVRASERFGNGDRLRWDILHISHHCSYLSLASEKGDKVTVPVDRVRRLMEHYGQEKCILISPSNVIPTDYDATQPPHRQALNYYAGVKEKKQGQIFITMEWPSKEAPRPLELAINNYGVTVVKTEIPAGFASTYTPPRAG
jgi:hypothetical protein